VVDRAISPVIGVVLLVIITVLLAAIVAGAVLGVSDEKAAPQTRIALAVDVDDDQIRLRHQAGDTLQADHTRIVWEIDGTRVSIEPTGTDQRLVAGESTTFTLDGSTAAHGTWSSYGSPGTVDIDPSDQLQVTLYDTVSGKPIIERTVTAGDVDRDLTVVSSGSGFIFAQDTTAGAQTSHEINWEIDASDSAEGSSLNNVEIRYPSGVEFPQVDSRSDITAAGFDEDGDGTIDDAATVECCPSDSDGDGDVDGDGVYQGYSGNPDILRIEFSGNADIDAGDEMIIRVREMENPSSSGSYTVNIGIDGAQTETGTLEID